MLRSDNNSGYCQTHYSYSPNDRANRKAHQIRYRSRAKELARNGRNMRDSTYKRYGLTAAQYYEMNDAQGGVCAICGGPPTSGLNRLSVDHCHKTNKVRGLLCRECNSGLGHFKDDDKRILRAAEYLNRAKSLPYQQLHPGDNKANDNSRQKA